MRLIEMMGQLARRIREMLARGDMAGAESMLLEESRQRGVDLALARCVSGESLVQLLAPGGPASDPTRLILMGEFLHLDGLRAEAEGGAPEARVLLAKSRLLLSTGLSYLTAMGSSLPEVEATIHDIDDRLESGERPPGA